MLIYIFTCAPDSDKLKAQVMNFRKTLAECKGCAQQIQVEFLNTHSNMPPTDRYIAPNPDAKELAPMACRPIVKA